VGGKGSRVKTFLNFQPLVFTIEKESRRGRKSEERTV